MTLDFIVDINENNGVALTIEDISSALQMFGYKTEFVKNITNPLHGALYVFGNTHKLSLNISGE